MKSDENTKVVVKKVEEREIVVKIGSAIYRFEKGNPEWEDWKNIPSYDDPDMIYALMLGTYVVEYRRLIPHEIKSVVKEEGAPSSDWSQKFNEACEIFNHMCLTLDSCTGEAGDREETIYEKFYDILFEVVTTFYSATFLDKLDDFASEIKQCEVKYDEFICILHNYQKALDSAKRDALPSCDAEVWRSADRLIRIFNELIKVFYDRSLKYGTYFRDISRNRICVS